jgi:hypothetical protein
MSKILEVLASMVTYNDHISYLFLMMHETISSFSTSYQVGRMFNVPCTFVSTYCFCILFLNFDF